MVIRFVVPGGREPRKLNSMARPNKRVRSIPVEARRLDELIFNNLITDGFECIVVGFFGRTGGHAHYQIHVCLNAYMIACMALRWKYVYPTRCAINCYMHEDVEAYGYLIGLDAKRRQRFDQISETTAMRLLVAIDNSKGVGTAWCQQEIVASHGVFHHREHHVASIGIELMSGGKEDGISIVNCSSGGKDFSRIVIIEAHKIRHLLSLQIGHEQLITAL